ncbi:acyl-CoA dehydrogenase [Kitasatospora aureofaciens]|uniref:acyl-CoA dehydrogenase n=1 Tax=Kitasatospora aureofaciens TaxID=1894 RepID=UPI001C45E9A0|nr:acyl-CoA dehydrogenase [Kitasatospora aureofaciens]MBV6701502.1 acyl-CoA dehydrogenase [Kitasatospora aureofaciens]
MTALLSPAPARARVAQIEAALGDPTEPGNPYGYRGLLAADRAAVPFAAVEDLLDGLGVSAEYVPQHLGGRLDSIETLVRVMRPLFRRDVGLGMGYGMHTFMAASDVWITGTPAQQEWLADLLLGGARAAIAQHETAHSNDYVRSQVAARRAGDGFLLTGSKPMINNLSRAEALVLFCRTDREPGSRSHSVLLLDPRQLPAGRATVLPRRHAVGLRGCLWTGIAFDDCPAPESALLGAAGSGVETALRSFQISRTVIAAMALAAVDTSLRTAVQFDLDRRLGGSYGSWTDPAKIDQALVGAFVNLLLYDALAVVAGRALHLLPEQTSVYSASLKYLLPKVLTKTMYDLSVVLGAGIYTRDGNLGIFQKHVRDVPVLSLGHAGTVACQATVIPQLPWLARRSWFAEPEPPAELFRLGTDVPPLDHARLSLACGRDSVSAALVAVADGAPGGSPADRALRTLASRLVGELRDLQQRVLALSDADWAGPRGAVSFPLADRYALLLAAASVAGVWQHSQGGRDPFLADPCWAAMALHRIARQLGTPVGELPPECGTRVRHELQLRFADRRSFDLYNTPVPG